MTDAKGPIFAAGFQSVTKSGYKLLYLADVNNDQLQREGKAPVYHWLPNEVRLARRDGDSGNYLFSMIHFVGVRSDGTHVGAAGDEEVTGGLVGFSTTAAPPASVLAESENELLERFRGKDTAYWGWRTPIAPMFRPAVITENICSITDLAPASDGTLPQPQPSGGGDGPPPSRAGRLRASLPPPMIGSRNVPIKQFPTSILRNGRAAMRGLDGWYVNLKGQGPGTVSPFAINTYSGLLGTYPAAIVWESFHGGTTPIGVYQDMKIRVWSPVVELHIEGEWDRIQDHFSAAAHAGGLFWSADVQAEFNNLQMSGGITVRCQVDQSLPDAQKLQQELDKRKDLVFQKFMDQAQKTIFDPAPFNEEPAEASGGFLGFGGGGAVKLRRDKTHLKLEYHEKTELAYLQPYPIRGQLEGLYEELQADPAAEKKYFRTLYLDDWDRKVTRIVKPVVNWPSPEQRWVGEPVAFLACQVGYPNTDGVVQWDSTSFVASDPPDRSWTSAMALKDAGDVSNPPAGWTPDKTFIKRSIHFTEPPNDTEYPFARIQIEKNVVELDPGELGALVDTNQLEVRVDNVGTLSLGPISLNVALQDATQVVEVTMQALGKTHDGLDRAPVRFQWKQIDVDEPRFWFVFTGQPDFVPKFRYQVRVIVKGSLFSAGMEWIGPWEEAGAGGSFIASVPRSDSPGVTTRSLNRSAAKRGRPPAVRSGAPVKKIGGPPPVRARRPRREPFSVGGWEIAAGDTARGAGKTRAPADEPVNGEPVFSGFTSKRP